MNSTMFQEVMKKAVCCCCQEEIPGLGIECSECPNRLIRLCCDCFSVGAECGNHKTTHKYHYFDTGSIKLNSLWQVREQVSLLDSIEKYGFGNWQDIAKDVETKSPQECKEEYVSRFVEGAIGKETWRSEAVKAELNIAIDHTVMDDGPLSPSLTAKLPPLEIGTEEATTLSFMPQRDDYEKEFDNDAEKLVSQLSFSPEDDELDISMKLAIVDMYMYRLRERVRRKRVVRDYQLVSQFFNKKKRKPTTSLTPFAQFCTATEHFQIISNLEKEKELKHRLQELKKYRKMGITKIEKCFEFERKKNSEDSSTKKSPILHHQQRQRNSTSTSAVMMALSSKSSTGDVDLSKHTDNYNNQKSSSNSSNNNNNNNNNATTEKENPRSGLHTPKSTPLLSFIGGPNLSSEESESDRRSLWLTGKLSKEAKQKGMVAQFTARYSSLLSQTEMRLCLDVKLYPEDYLLIKTALLTDPDLKRPDCVSQKDWKKLENYVNSL